MKKVKFKDGTFGLRKGYFKWSYRYFDFTSLGFWWSLRSKCMKYCHTTEEEVDSVLNLTIDEGKIVK